MVSCKAILDHPSLSADLAYSTRSVTIAGVASRIYGVARWIVLILLLVSIALVLRKAPAPAVDTNPAAKETLHAKREEEQAASDNKQPHALKMNEAELNSMLASNLQLAPAAPAPASQVQSSVRDVKINLLEDRMRAYVLFTFHGADLSLQLEGQLGVRGGHLRLRRAGANWGRFRYPDSRSIAPSRACSTRPETRRNSASLPKSPTSA